MIGYPSIMATPTPPPSEPGRDGLGRAHGGLTPRERQAFDEIERRLRAELGSADSRRAPALWSALIVIGSIVGAIGLVLLDNVAVSFGGFVAVVVGVERFTHTRTKHWWRRLVARWTAWRSSN